MTIRDTMKNTVKSLSLLFLMLGSTAFGSKAQSDDEDPEFYLHENGVTVVCTEAIEGERGQVNGTWYTKREADQITTQNASTTCTSGIMIMDKIFELESTFNEDISHWDVSSAVSMYGLFLFAESFNQDLSYWDVSNVEDMISVFSGADRFNQDISGWDVSNATSMFGMFTGADDFNQDISGWDVSNVENMQSMFRKTESFNQDIGSWDVGNVTVMRAMFSGAQSFNQDISGWNVSNVDNMKSMFKEAAAFNQDLSGWCVSLISSEPEDFNTDGVLDEEHYPQWGAPCAPIAVSSTPVKGALEVSPDSAIVVEFDQVISEGSNFGDITIQDSVDAQVGNLSAEIDSNLIIITHDGLEYEMQYTVTIPSGAVSSDVGDCDAYSWSFTTEMAPPFAINEMPANGSTDISLDTTLSVAFDREVTASNLDTVEVVDAFGNAVMIDTLYLDENVLTIVHTGLEYETEYIVHIYDSTVVRDSLLGNPAFSWSFTTEEENTTHLELGEIPGNFELKQNFPNPFNPVTQISYALPKAVNVRLDVYNMLGQHVGTLVNARQQPGLHTISFDAANLSSGTYIYRLTAGSFIEIRQMMLLK